MKQLPRDAWHLCALAAAMTMSQACSCRPAGSAAPPTSMVFSVPRARGPITIDGKCCAEKGWQDSFRSPLFEDAHGRRVPFTELRAAADDDYLYLEVYVADADIRSQGDLVRLTLGPLSIELTPKGAKAPAGVRTAVDTDDTVDDPRSNDEEWVNEVAVPWKLLGAHEVLLRAFRVDVGVGGPPHALAWPRSAPALLRFAANQET